MKRIGCMMLCLVTATLAQGEVMFPRTGEPWTWTCYAEGGGGVAFLAGTAAPRFDTAAGFVLSPEWRWGGFTTFTPLSDFGHAPWHLTVANQEAAFSYQSGTELWYVLAPEQWVHPIAGIRVGGVTTGRLVDLDGREGYEGSVGERAFFASLALGAEANLTESLGLVLKTGWRLANNGTTLGIESKALGGPELSLGLRLSWRTVFD